MFPRINDLDDSGSRNLLTMSLASPATNTPITLLTVSVSGTARGGLFSPKILKAFWKATPLCVCLENKPDLFTHKL